MFKLFLKTRFKVIWAYRILGPFIWRKMQTCITKIYNVEFCLIILIIFSLLLHILLIHDPLVKMSRDRMVTVEEIVKIIQVVPYYPTGSILEPPVDKIKLVDTNTQWKNNFLRPISSSSILVPFLLPQNMLVKMLYHI